MDGIGPQKCLPGSLNQGLRNLGAEELGAPTPGMINKKNRRPGILADRGGILSGQFDIF
jgi:hypothetical protein